MLAITPNQLDTMGKEFHHTSQRVPKCHRKFRTAFAALSDLPDMPPLTDRLRSPNGFSSSSTAAVEEALNHCLRGLDRSRTLIVTSGARWTGRQTSFPGVTVLQVDCRHFHDAESDRSLRGCVGRHPSIMQGLAATEAMQELINQVKDFLRANPNGRLVINLFCTSGRHRSVAAGTMIYHYLETTDARAPMLIHYHSPEWQDMSCGGRCSLCGTADARELSRLIDRFLPDVRIVSSTVPRPTLTPARDHITGPTRTHSTGPTRTHSTVPVPLRGPLPPSLATTSSGTPLTRSISWRRPRL